MSNNNNDMDPNDNFDTDLGFEDGQDGEKKRSPLMKIVVIGAGLVAVLVGIMMFGGGPTDVNKTKSAVAPAPVDPRSLPAQQEPTPEFREAMDQYNSEIIQKANETGESAIPIPVDPARKQIETTVQENQEDPAERFRRIQEEYRRQQEQQQQQQQGQQVEADAQARQQAIQKLAQAMGTYMNGTVATRKPPHMNTMSITYVDPDDDKEGDGTGTGPGVGPDGKPIAPSEGKMLLPATTIEYGQLLIEANTDAPGPVLALMVTGKLAGSRLLGDFQSTDEYITLNFNILVTKDGRSIPISAIAIDPDTTLPGVITEIDRKYFQRIVIPAAAEFISGVGSAIAETQTTSTQNDSTTETSGDDPDFSEAIAQGIEDSFDGVADVLEKDAGRAQIMLRVAAGTPIGILFTQEVREPVEQQAVAEPQQQNPMAQMGQIPYGFAYPAQFPYPAPAGAPVAQPATAPAATVEPTPPIQGQKR